ncbi:ABC transporter permease [Acetobacter sp. TBRC 12305]|uniref:ABC transporter permease n=1 Tax=Acetobacter garciniae TaxID=2817435 RepID=A0A939HN94_9PROT|nr:ABC transporter permease [Acetobacter garciniae]MBO1324839.1 ABC transporter permease [Acetobacter garciniae]MBX0344530.1 ABC transporter permease [Acetobacter garciniae]
MKKAFSDHLLDWSGRLLVLLILIFIALPFIVVFIVSFNDSSVVEFPPKHWSLRWYFNAFSYEDFVKGLRNSLMVAAVGSAISLIVGAMFAFVFNRYEFSIRRPLHAILMSPLIVPNFTIGLGALLLAKGIFVPRSFGLLVLVHVMVTLPFVVRGVSVSLQNFNQAYERAAESLGASPWYILITLTMPLLLPGLISGWLFAAVLSFNEFSASLFVANLRNQTLPIAMYNYVREYADPTLAALAVLYVVTSAAVLTVLHVFFRLEKVLNVE